MVNQSRIKLSILVPTIGRTIELSALLHSILDAKLSFPYEIVLIDQNPIGYLDEVLNNYRNKLPIKHHVVKFKGLSKAKNYGVKVSCGSFICFPDDDCKIFPDTFLNAFSLIEKENADLVFGKCIDENRADSVLRFQKKQYILNHHNMLGGFVEATVVCKRVVFMNFEFDENMGAGTFFGAEEGFDWLYRILSHSNLKAVFSPEITFFHPQVIVSKGDISALNRVFKYRCGTAYLCQKHSFNKRYFSRVFLSFLAYLFYFFINKNKSEYYKTEWMALQIGKIFAKKNISSLKKDSFSSRE